MRFLRVHRLRSDQQAAWLGKVPSSGHCLENLLLVQKLRNTRHTVDGSHPRPRGQMAHDNHCLRVHVHLCSSSWALRPASSITSVFFLWPEGLPTLGNHVPSRTARLPSTASCWTPCLFSNNMCDFRHRCKSFFGDGCFSGRGVGLQGKWKSGNLFVSQPDGLMGCSQDWFLHGPFTCDVLPRMRDVKTRDQVQSCVFHSGFKIWCQVEQS